MMDYELRQINGWKYFCLPSIEKKGIIHGFFARMSPLLDSDVGERKSFIEDFSLRRIITMKQEHGDLFHVIRAGADPVAGDGIILLEKDVAGVIRTADCLPVIIADPQYPMAAIIHAGWRGTAKKIVSKVVREMVKLGSSATRLTALLGPSIGPCCYEIQKDVHSIFLEERFPDQIFGEIKGSLHLDLRAANEWLLREEGLQEIYSTQVCTFCRDDLFASYRRGDRASRQINFVSLAG
jgi:polyphenol oxidase